MGKDWQSQCPEVDVDYATIPCRLSTLHFPRFSFTRNKTVPQFHVVSARYTFRGLALQEIKLYFEKRIRALEECL